MVAGGLPLFRTPIRRTKGVTQWGHAARGDGAAEAATCRATARDARDARGGRAARAGAGANHADQRGAICADLRR